ncbi:MAG: pentapeptide repeat-containing protein, partial [Actinophytocola sp.]|uniref:NACHT and WD40 repeat domain-containing protein n=1 Tax=Actinophytocola sp. TaxID=1872138 RepID=UPI003D6B34BD
MNPLRQTEIAVHLDALRPSLTTMQAARLAAILEIVGDDRRFVLREALAAAEFPSGDRRAQEAFVDFRRKVNDAAKNAGVDLQLELDSRKVPPDQRYGWFTGGDLIDEGIASFTGAAAERDEVAHSVAPEVSELGKHRRIRLYVSFHPTTGPTVRRVDALLEQLRNRLGTDPERSWDVVDPRSVELGEDVERTRDRLAAEADVRVALLSPAYLADTVERSRVLDGPDPLVAVAFSVLPDGPVPLGRLQRQEVRRRNEPWDQQTSSKQRSNFVADLDDLIRSALTAPPARSDRRDELEAFSHLAYRRKSGSDPDHLVPAELAETSLRESHLDGSQPTAGPPVLAVDRLVDWVTDRRAGAPRLCALLGDVGMGKTTTAKLFTQRLLDLRDRGKRVPLPILFDLRDVRVPDLADSMTLDRILDTMIDATRPTGVPQERLCADVVRQRLDAGDAVVIFDGLDEVLVNLGDHDRQLFTRQLWRSLSKKSTSRMLLTCRTQFFRTIRDQVTFFTGEDREGLRGSDYLALLMVPFRDEQVREYLAENVDRDPEWVDGFLETIAAVHDLPELTRRPLTLRLIADQLDFIERAKLEGRTLRSVDIYSEVVARWIARDSGKHTLTPDHKRLLMEEIAAALWRSGRNEWTPTEVDDWLLDVLDRRPDLRRHYEKPLPDLWKADFRTATFLKREGDAFQFGHRSLFEYFLACHLFRTLSDGTDDLAMPVPSQETLEFLGQSIAAAPDKPLVALRRIGSRYAPMASELMLAYCVHAAGRGHPHPDLTGVHLEGAQLSGWTIGASDRLLSMAGASFAGADLRRTTFRRVDLSRADLTNADTGNAELHDSRLSRSTWDGTRAVGTILRKCDIANLDLEHAETYRTQLLFCEPTPASSEGLLVAPSAVETRPGPFALRTFTGHSSGVLAVAWSPDGTRILTAGSDPIVRVWDADTGELIYHITGHTGEVRAVAWSPDGTRILTASADSTARIWNADTGELIYHITGHTGEVRAVAWSPDGTRILTASADMPAQIWNADTGQPTHQLTGNTGWVQAVAWSPDGTRILTASADMPAQIWNADTGQPTHQLTGNTSEMRAVAWSPDGTRILTASANSTAQIWNADTGQPTHQLTGNTHWVQA